MSPWGLAVQNRMYLEQESMPCPLVTSYNGFTLTRGFFFFFPDFNCSAGCGWGEEHFRISHLPWTEQPILKKLVTPDAFINHSQNMKGCVLHWLSNVTTILNKYSTSFYSGTWMQPSAYLHDLRPDIGKIESALPCKLLYYLTCIIILIFCNLTSIQINF